MAEVEINKSMHVKVNDKEHMAFKLLCVREGQDMSVVIRGLMREYMASRHLEELPYIRLGPRNLRFSTKEIDEFLEAGGTRAAARA